MSKLRRRPANHGGGNPETEKENEAGEAIRYGDKRHGFNPTNMRISRAVGTPRVPKGDLPPL